MSDTGYTTSETSQDPCSECHMLVTKNLIRGVKSGEALTWKTQPHPAPCGRQCFGGGAMGTAQVRAWRNGEFHTLKACQSCVH